MSIVSRWTKFGLTIVVLDVIVLATRGAYALIHTDHWPDDVTAVMILGAMVGGVAAAAAIGSHVETLLRRERTEGHLDAAEARKRMEFEDSD
jgi:uncharacterized transporter YbjL